ncbi:MAG: uroporphyrinogen decarboxylase family protein [Caldilineaceae bacterium]
MTTPRERVLSAFSGQPSGWPLDMGACVVTGIPMELHRHLAPDAAPTLWADEILNQAHPLQEVADRVGSDVLRAGFVFDRKPLQLDEVRTDRFGTTWANFDGQSSTTQYPFAHLTTREILRHPKPDPNQLQVAAPPPNTNHAILCDAPISSIFEQASRLRGYGKLQEDFADNPRLVSVLLDYALEMALAWYQNLLSRLPVAPDLVLVAEDLGYQNSLAISPELYRIFVKPRQRQLIRFIKRTSNARIVFHSCGAIWPILRDLCQLEIDALHIQPSAQNMHPAHLRQLIPREMVLYGMLDMPVWLPSLVTKEQPAMARLFRYLEMCQPVIVGPTDLIAGGEASDLTQGVTNLSKILK